MAGSASEESGVETSSDEISTAQQLCRSSEALALWRSSEQFESGSLSISPPYWDTDDDDDDCGPKPSELYGRYTWKIDRFSQINKRELHSNAFEVGSYKWYILIYPQGCDVCNHLSLFLCVANHDKLNPGWSHFAQFTIAVVNKDPKKSKYSDTLHRFWKKEHDWGWKKFMELSKVLDGFLDDDTLIIKAQVQIIRERVDRPFRCLDCQYRRELVRVYLSNVEQICRRFVEERRAKLGKMMEDKVRWPSFRAFWLAIDPIARRCMSREKAESVLKVLVKHFFIEKEVTSTLVMDSLNSGFKALQGQTNNSKAKGKYVVEEEKVVPIVRLEKDAFILVDDVLLLLERAAMEPLSPMDEKGPQNRTKDVDSGEDFSKDSIERDEMRLTELGRRTIEIFVLAHIFSSNIEVVYQEAVAFMRQEELIREEAAWLAESEQKMRRGFADKDKKSKKKQGKQKRNNRKVREKVKYEKPDIVVEDKAGCKRNAFLVDEAEPVDHPLEDVSDVSDSVNCTRQLLEADPEDQDFSPVTWDTDTSKIHPSTEANSSGITGVPFVRNGERKTLSVLDDSSSTCSNDSLSSVLANGLGKVNSVIKQNSQNSLSRGNSQRVKAVQGETGCAIDTNIHPANTSHRAEVIRTLGMAEPDKAVSNSLQHRIKWTEEVAKKEEVVCSQKKSTVTVEAGVGEPSTAKTTGIQSSSKSLLKNLSSAVQSNSQSKIAAAIDSVLVRKSSCLSAQRTDKMPNTENLTECIIASKDATTAMSRLTDKPITQLVSSLYENSNIGMSGTTEKPIAQPKTEKPNATQPGILRPVSAPSIARTEVCTPAVPIVQTAQSLSRSVSAAGRLGGNPSPSTTSHLPQSYQNIMMGDHATRGHSLTQSPNLEVNTPHPYLQSSAVVSAPMYLSQNSERLDTNSIRSNLSFGIFNQDVLQDGPQWMESPRTDSRRSHCNFAIQNGTHWMENHQRDTIRNINDIRSLCSDIQNFHMDRSIQSISQDQYPFGYSARTLGRHNVGVSADDFPHLDIINNLLEEEHGFVRAAATNSAFQTFSNAPHHLNQQFTLRGDIGLSADLVPSTRSGMFEQTQSFYDDEYYHNYNSASDQFNSNLIHQAHIQPCQNGYIDELIPNQWQIGNSNLSYPSMRRLENDDFSYHIPEYSNLVSGVNGYTVFLPSSG